MIQICKYCGTKRYGQICENCEAKLKLIRQIQQMVRNAQKERDKEKERKERWLII